MNYLSNFKNYSNFNGKNIFLIKNQRYYTMKNITNYLKVNESRSKGGISLVEYALAYILENIDKAKNLLDIMNDYSEETVLYNMANYVGEVAPNTPFDDEEIYEVKDFDIDYLISKMKGVTPKQLFSKTTDDDREYLKNIFTEKA